MSEQDIVERWLRDPLYAGNIEAIRAEITTLRARLAKAEARVGELEAGINRYRYVYQWWASDSFDYGGEFQSRMNWARGEDNHRLSNDEIATIGHTFLTASGRIVRSLLNAVEPKPAPEESE